jgi:hypothetical protein
MKQPIALVAGLVAAALLALAVATRAGELTPPEGEIEPTMLTLEELGETLNQIRSSLAADCGCDCPSLQVFDVTLDEESFNLAASSRHVESFTIGLDRQAGVTSVTLEVWAGATRLFDVFLQRGESRSYHVGADLASLRLDYPGTIPARIRATLTACASR